MATIKPAVNTLPSPRAFRRARVLVVGDVMLDRYWFGDVSRISPEAPVPVVKVDRSEDRPGGAANVARNAAALGARVTLLSVVGQDEPGRRLRQLLREEKITARLHYDRSIDTTVKLRVIGRQQQLLRIDFETTPSHEILRSKLSDYARLIAACDVVVLSDYGKGGLAHISRMITLARRYRKLKVDALLVTRSEEGMTLFTRKARLHAAAQAREVFDVSGAGDTVIATLAVALAAGSALEAAVELANRAAGIVVGKFGTAVVRPEELFPEQDGEAGSRIEDRGSKTPKKRKPGRKSR